MSLPPHPNKVFTETKIFRSEDIAIDFFSWCSESNKAVAITFTPFGADGEISLAGVGYGGEFLLRNDFDVIAIKSIKNLWYQNLSLETVETVANFISTHPSRYTRRVGYGSSMGAYATIQFSRNLRLDVVLAISPQFEIDKPYDQRWQAAAKEINFQHRIDAATIAENCKYFIAYDPETKDIQHIEKLRELISKANLVEIETPYSGHPSAYYLAETGLIQELALSVLKKGSTEEIAVSAHRKRSKTYLYELSKQLTHRNKNKSALIVIKKALDIDENAPAFHLHHSVILNNLGQPEAALVAAYEARLRLNNDAHLMGALSVQLAKYNDFGGALELVERAIGIDNRITEFHLHRCAVCKALGDIPEAIVSGEKALQLSPNNASLMARVSRLHARRGGVAGWTRAFVLAKNAIFSLFS